VGLEARCNVRYGGRSAEGKALLETNELLFRGDFRLRVPFQDMAGVEAVDGELSFSFGDQAAVFELGDKAAVWADRIRNPRGRLDKLGVKAGARVIVLGLEDAAFVNELRQRGVTVGSATEPGAAVVFYAADSSAELVRLPELKRLIEPAGALWVVSKKGKAATIKDVDVMAAARASGLVDTKVVAFSESQTALKLVVPAAQRR
jgi:hypothetical protein